MSALSRIQDKLSKSKEELDFYEAHQLYTTLYYRYNLKQKHEEARAMMEDGAKFLFANNQFGSAADLSLLYVESLEQSLKEINDDIIATLGTLHSLMPGYMTEVEAFDKRALLWSSKCKNVPKTGDKQLRKLFAINYWKNKMYYEARQNFLYSSHDTGMLFGKMLQEVATTQGLPGEIDLFLAQAVLQLLCLQSYQQASEVFNTYTQSHPKIGKGPPFKYPLINFLCFLLVAVKKQQVTVFTILCEQYHISLKRDVLYFDYLEKIGESYFGIEPPEKPESGGGIFKSLMQNLFDDESEMSEGLQVKKQPTARTMTEEDLD